MMKRLCQISIVLIFLLMYLAGYGQSCTQSSSASGDDCDNFTTSVTINCAPAGATITGIDVTGTIGSYCPSWYKYDIYLDGTWYYSYCNGTNSFSDLNGNVANGTVIYLRSWDNDVYCDYVTLSLEVTVYYTESVTGPCDNIISISDCGSSYAQSYTGGGAGVWNTSYCGYGTPGEEQVYSFVAPSTGTYSIEVTEASGYVDYGWQAGTCAETGWNCIDDIASAGNFGSMSWTAGTTYYILLDDENSTAGTHTLYLNCPVNHCVSTDYWLSSEAPTDDIPIQVSSCNFAGEYNQVTNVVAGETYEFSSSVSTDWITLTNTSEALLEEGTTPITWTATFSGTVYVHIHTDSGCGSEDLCREQWVTCTSCGGGGTQDYYTHPTEGLQSTYLGACMVNIDCGETPSYYDDGGPTINYANSINHYYRTFCPDAPGKCMRATINDFSIEDDGWGGCYDYLTISNGPTQNSPILWEGCGSSGSPVTRDGSYSSTITSTDPSGCLTFRFYSDGTVNESGWDISLSCVNCSENNYEETSECKGSCATCGDTDFSGASTGPGIESTCTGCIVSENYTTWYYFEIATGGVFEFEVVPNNLGDAGGCTECDDYDFALFQADECNNLGSPVRCSYAWNERCYDDTGPYTGMADIHPYSGVAVTDYTEDVSGDGFVKSLDVTAGQTYFLMINGWSPSDAGYELSFNLTGGGTFEDCAELDPLPVELIAFDAACEDNDVILTWTTASEANNDYFTVMKSYNGFMFKPIGQVNGQGNSNFHNDYTFRDDEFSEGTVFYQLKQTDFDGSQKPSEIIEVDCDKGIEKIAITAQDNSIIIHFENAQSYAYTFNLYNNIGQLAMKKDIVLTDSHQEVSIPAASLRPGIYNAIVTSDNSMEFARLFIK